MMRIILNKIKEFIVRKKKLQTHLLGQSLLLLIVSMGAIIFENYYKNTENMINVAKKEVKLTMDSLRVPPIDESIKISHEINNVLSYIFPYVKDYQKEIWFFNVISYFVEKNPFITSIVFGTPSGFFFDITDSRIYKEHAKRLSLKIPPKTTSVVKMTQVNKPGEETEEIWNYIQDYKKIVKTEKGARTGFDPRTRPWYLEALKTKKPIWTPIYIFADWTIMQPGLTYAQSIFDPQGNFMGVLGVDVGLKDLAKILKTCSQMTPHTMLYIIEDNKKVITSSKSFEKKAYDESDFNYLVSNHSDKTHKILNEALQVRKNQDKQSIIFSYGLEKYIAFFEKFTHLTFPHNWDCVLISPVNDFTFDIQKARNTSLIYSIFILLIGVLWSFHLSRRISHPVIALTEETHRLQRLELNTLHPIESSIKEITILRDAILGLKTTMQSFSYYIPKDLVKKLLSRKRLIHTGGHAKEVAIMFTDIQNFTNTAESLAPDKVIRYLSDYFEELTSIVMEHNGTVDKFIGDAIMAFWGMASNDKKLAYNACRSALLCQKRLQSLNRVWAEDQRPTFITRFGLHMGTVIMGNVGSSDRMNYTAIGDNVNLSSRLESLNKYYGTHIIASEAIYQAAKSHFLFRRLDDVAVKGKDKSIIVYEVIGQLVGDDNLYPSDYQIEFCAKFEEARALYMTRQWPEALKAFKNLLKYPHATTDKTLEIYMSRCDDLIKNPPPQDWNGSIHLREK